jgi:hypothetical protein
VERAFATRALLRGVETLEDAEGDHHEEHGGDDRLDHGEATVVRDAESSHPDGYRPGAEGA